MCRFSPASNAPRHEDEDDDEMRKIYASVYHRRRRRPGQILFKASLFVFPPTLLAPLPLRGFCFTTKLHIQSKSKNR